MSRLRGPARRARSVLRERSKYADDPSFWEMRVDHEIPDRRAWWLPLAVSRWLERRAPGWLSRSRGGRVAILALVAVAGMVLAPVVVPSSSQAFADPSSDAWYELRMCESSNRYDINTGNGYYGAYQFDLPTWQSVGGSGYPHEATPEEQDARALMLYRMRGWQPWTCARIVGLQEDSDARSGYIDDIVIGGGTGGGSGGGGGDGGGGTGDMPQWPGTLRPGDSGEGVKQWQLQMKARGAPLTGTGYFGEKTLAVVHKLQRDNGLNVMDLIGPKTWTAAWTGSYTADATGYAAGDTTAPMWPGTIRPSESSADLKEWQLRMKARGAPLTGTGYFGPATLAVVHAVQQQNGFAVTDLIGPKTWTAAWTGSYNP